MNEHYREAPRSYLSAVLLAALLGAGWVLDAVLGGGATHAFAWAAAIVIVAGADAWTVQVARRSRTITLTASDLRVGTATVARTDIAGVEADFAGVAPIFGRAPGAGLPRGTQPLTLRMSDGTRLIVATRRPDQLAAALGVGEVMHEIRRASVADLELLPDIEARADQLFAVSDIEIFPAPASADVLREAAAVYVADRPPVGFVRVEELDGVAHIEQISVLPRMMRRGIGSALVEAACEWARERGYRAVTLITYADIAWNAPFYARLGFVESDELTPGLVELRDWERDVGMDRVGRRIVMRRELR